MEDYSQSVSPRAVRRLKRFAERTIRKRGPHADAWGDQIGWNATSYGRGDCWRAAEQLRSGLPCSFGDLPPCKISEHLVKSLLSGTEWPGLRLGYEPSKIQAGDREMVAREGTNIVAKKPAPEEPARELLGQRKRPEKGRFLLQVDRQTKTSYATMKLPKRPGW